MQESLNIAHVIPSLAKGGGERVVIDLANAQVASGHHVAVVLGREVGDAPSAVFDPRIEIRVIAGAKTGKAALYRALLGWQLRHRAWLGSLDVIHCHLTFGSAFGSLASLVLPRGRRRPVIIETYHAVGMAISAAMRAMHARMASRRDALVLMAVDGYWGKFAAKHPKLLISLIENGVTSPHSRVGTPEQRLEKKNRLCLPADSGVIVGTVGQLRPDRQPWLHVDLFARIAKKLGHGVDFVIAGDGPARPCVEAAIAAANLLNRVRLLGVTASAAEPASLMDLYVTLAVGPVVGIAALEAMFAGVPTIAIQLDPSYSAREGDLVWSSTDLEALATRAAHLLQDSEALATLGNAQQKTAISRYDMANVRAKYDAVYRSARAALQVRSSANNVRRA